MVRAISQRPQREWLNGKFVIAKVIERAAAERGIVTPELRCRVGGVKGRRTWLVVGYRVPLARRNRRGAFG